MDLVGELGDECGIQIGIRGETAGGQCRKSGGVINNDKRVAVAAELGGQAGRRVAVR
jgi:hypothetical protein